VLGEVAHDEVSSGTADAVCSDNFGIDARWQLVVERPERLERGEDVAVPVRGCGGPDDDVLAVCSLLTDGPQVLPALGQCLVECRSQRHRVGATQFTGVVGDGDSDARLCSLDGDATLFVSEERDQEGGYSAWTESGARATRVRRGRVVRYCGASGCSQVVNSVPHVHWYGTAVDVRDEAVVVGGCR
jgi:hypothetical protein